jgi:hypothetical protein
VALGVHPPSKRVCILFANFVHFNDILTTATALKVLAIYHLLTGNWVKVAKVITGYHIISTFLRCRIKPRISYKRL